MHSTDLMSQTTSLTHILIVEDDPPQRELIEILLREHPWEEPPGILFASSPVETLDMLGRLPIDVVLLDLTLPDARGTATFEAVCENFPRVPVIVLTGDPSESLSHEAISSGAQDFLSKDAALAGDGWLLCRTVTNSIERMRTRQRLLQAEREITARRYAAEIQQLREQSILGELVTLMSQQLTQPLSAVASYEATLRVKWQGSEDPDIVTLLDSIERETNAAIDIMRQMRRRIQTPRSRSELVDVSELLDRAISNLRECESEMESVIRFSVPNEPLIVRGDRFQLEQVFVGLIRNGIEAVQSQRSGGVVGVFCRNRKQEVSIEIDDNGARMSDETFRRLEEPFFTTKPIGAGVGLGISMARSIVELHGGVLAFERRRLDGMISNGLRALIRLPRVVQSNLPKAN